MNESHSHRGWLKREFRRCGALRPKTWCQQCRTQGWSMHAPEASVQSLFPNTPPSGRHRSRFRIQTIKSLSQSETTTPS